MRWLGVGGDMADGRGGRLMPAPPLPPVTVARFEQVALLIERLAQEKTSVFLGAMASYADQHRAASARPLTHTEAAAIAGQLAGQLGEDDVATLAADVQKSDLRASERPEPRELLLAAGTRTAPAFLDAALRVCALIEMPADAFKEALESDTLEFAVNGAAEDLRQLPMLDARPRAAAALEHFVRQTTGGSPGEAWGLLTGTV